MGDEPCLRGTTSVVNALTHLQTLPSTLQAVGADLGEETMGRLKRVGALEWVPASLFLPFVQAVDRALGTAPARAEFWKRASLRSFEHPLVLGSLRLVLRMAGASPAALVKTIPNSWGLISKHFGQMKPQDPKRPNEIELHWVDIPPVLIADLSYPDAMRLGMYSFFEIFKRPGSIEGTVNAKERSYLMRFSWKD